MRTIGMFEAKTHLPEIIRNVQKGESYLLTNRNLEVAVIMPVADYNRNVKGFAYEKIKAIFQTSTLGSPNDINQLRDEGRK